MFSKSSFLSVILIGLEIVSAAAIGSVKRQTTDTTFSLYAYNKNISGLPVFYGDGLSFLSFLSVFLSYCFALESCQY